MSRLLAAAVTLLLPCLLIYRTSIFLLQIEVMKPCCSCHAQFTETHRVIGQRPSLVGENVAKVCLARLRDDTSRKVDIPYLAQLLIYRGRPCFHWRIRVLIIHVDVIHQDHLKELHDLQTDVK